MYQQAVGFNPGQRLLSGLNTKGNAGAFAKGQAMQAASGLNMDREQQNQQFGVQQMQQESQQRQQQSGNRAQQAQNSIQERMQQGEQANRRSVFDMGMRYDYAGLQKQRQLRLQQALLNQVARDF